MCEEAIYMQACLKYQNRFWYDSIVVIFCHAIKPACSYFLRLQVGYESLGYRADVAFFMLDAIGFHLLGRKEPQRVSLTKDFGIVSYDAWW